MRNYKKEDEIMFEIIKPDWHWRINPNVSPLNLNKVDGIGLHHSDHQTADIWEIERWHLERDNRSWKGFGYNYAIGFQGEIYEGRGLNQGAGIENHNSHVISILFLGDYDDGSMYLNEVQINAGIWLIFEYLMPKLPNLNFVGGHKDWNPTACPGQYFDLDKFRWQIGQDIPKITIKENSLSENIQTEKTWQQETGEKAIDKLFNMNFINNPEVWKDKDLEHEYVPLWLFFEMLKRLKE